jgi:hypothetical protein
MPYFLGVCLSIRKDGQGNRIEPIFEGVFPQNEEFGGVCGASLHKHPYFLLLVERKLEDVIAL